MKYVIFMFVTLLASSPVFAKGALVQNTFGEATDAPGTAAGSIDAFKCDRCGETAFNRSRGLIGNPAAYAEAVTDATRKIDQNSSESFALND